jgi:hypothetical protein
MNAIQTTIADYIRSNAEPSQHTLLCFVGMIETGEAVIADFVAVGGEKLAKLVASAMGATNAR